MICLGPCLTLNDDGELTVDLDPRSCNRASCGDDGLYVPGTDIESELFVAFGTLNYGPGDEFTASGEDAIYREVCALIENDDPCERTMEVDVWFQWGGAEAFLPPATGPAATDNSRLFLEYQISEDAGATYASHAAYKADGLGPGAPTHIVGQGGTSTYRTYTIAAGASRELCARTLCTVAQANGDGNGPMHTGNLSVYAVTILVQKRWEA